MPDLLRAYTMAGHKTPLLGKPKNGGAVRAKLTRRQVDVMRRWATREGFGLTTAAQARALSAQYPGLSVRTICTILENDSYRDPSFDRTVPDVHAALYRDIT